MFSSKQKTKMPDEQKKPGNGEMPDAVVAILITLDKNGVVNVNGPLVDKVLCYGLLERAKDIVRIYKATEEKKLIHADALSLKMIGSSKPS